MFTPIIRKMQARILKNCQEPGCKEQFWGIKISKYCPEHATSTYRAKRKIEKDSLCGDQIGGIKYFYHTYTKITKHVYQCGQAGCSNLISADIFPLQYEYPLYCEAHRTKWRRRNETI